MGEAMVEPDNYSGMGVSYIETERFILRPLTTADVTPRYLSWLRDEKSNRFIVTASSGHTLDSLKTYIEERIDREDILFLGIFLKDNNLHIGNIKFEPIDRTEGTATMGILIGDPDWRGRGAAAEVLNACAKWLYENRSIARIHLGVDRDNQSAIRAYLKAGFRIVRDSDADSRPSSALKMIRKHTTLCRLALGTVQFGLPYGVANESGQVSHIEAGAILEHAWAAGIDTLDTAIAYGQSEQRLGEIGIDNWHVVTKLPTMPDACTMVRDWVQESVRSSLHRLRISRLHGLLLHRSQQLLEPQGEELYAALLELKEQGCVEKIGVSIYDPEELDNLYPHFKLDLVQAPFNVLDRRLDASGWLARLYRAGTEVHVRSVFLQGLLLMGAMQRPKKFDRWMPLWNDWSRWLEEQEVTPLQACLGFALSQQEIGRVVVGVDNKKQLQEILAAAELEVPLPPDFLQSDDLDLINPSRWDML